mmetsp:Transcript_22026/g.45632  ORF Transcript_22026/g.45632 Transcript_22026/m.45632 type:complete len:84 (-) Transcript_22026:165-416(-)
MGQWEGLGFRADYQIVVVLVVDDVQSVCRYGHRFSVERRNVWLLRRWYPDEDDCGDNEEEMKMEKKMRVVGVMRADLEPGRNY